MGAGPGLMLTDQDSNLNRQNQNLQCYRYTIGQYLFDSGGKDKTIFFHGNNFFRIFLLMHSSGQGSHFRGLPGGCPYWRVFVKNVKKGNFSCVFS